MNIIDAELKFNGPLIYENYPKEIILHHADKTNCTIQDVHQWHLENGWVGIGYHFFVTKDGRVFKGRPENAVGAHCPKHNDKSLGICCEGDFSKDEMQNIQYNVIIDLVKYIKAKYGKLPIYGHGELYSTTCPEVNFPLDKIKNEQSNLYTVGWHYNSTGWYYITNELGWYYKDCWQEIKNTNDDKLKYWYSFDSQGYARESKWIQDEGHWYYLKSNCIMAKSEWLWIDCECYYFNEHGELLLNTITPDGYKVDYNGSWIH